LTVPKIFSLLRPPLGGGTDATRRARVLAAPFRLAVALLVAALAFGAAMAGNFGDNPVFAQTTVDYDDDDDGLIDVKTLAQLAAIGRDLDGNGDVAAGADTTAYNAAFPTRDTTSGGRMGCPSGACTGYELRAHLDFDTDGDGSTYTGSGASASGDTGDTYNNSGNGWAPIGSDTSAATRFAATFKGNGYVISNLFIKRASVDDVGLFGGISGRVESVGLANAYVNGDEYVGSLVGYSRGTVAASWVDGAVRGRRYVGGLVGYTLNGAITASYSHASAHASITSGGALVGGLTGRTHNSNVTASYSTGAVTAGTSSDVSGLTNLLGSSNIANSYWDTSTSGITSAGSGAGGAGHAATALQGPTGYTGIYSAWNVNVDGVSGNDDPWDFGTSSQYPALKFGGMDPIQQRGDYDLDGDGLIEITTLAQLNAVRHDLDGNGDVATGAPTTAYNAAFINRDSTAGARMGCPSGTCSGYELAAHLDFDTDGDGRTYTGSGASAASDSGDAYHNGGSGWLQIAVWPNTYDATFKGNGFIISNLFIKRTTTSYLGMIGQLGAAGRVESVGLYNAFVHGRDFTGSLVGLNEGTVAASWSSGAVRGTQFIGGLVGYNNTNSAGKPSTITASYSRAAVHSTATTNAYAGGLTGSTSGFTGGTARVIASYSTGAVTAGTNNRRAGLSNTSGTSSIAASYWDTTTSGVADDADTNPPEGKTSAVLKAETGYTGIYAAWNVDVDGTTGNDDPWDFGTSSDYPALKYGGMDPIQQRGDYDRDDDGFIDVATLAQLDAIRHDLNGNGDSAHAVYIKAFPYRAAAAAVRMGCPSGTCTGYELVSDLDFDTDGDGSTYTGSGASAAGDSGDAYYNGGAGWLPIGLDNLSINRFATTFRGNGHVIYNLFIKRRDTSDVGLFGALYATARVESLGVANGYAYGNQGTGLVAGTNRGTVAACWSSGAARGKDIYVGGLVGFNFAGGGVPTEAGDIIASFSTASVHSEKTGGAAYAAGLAGVSNGNAANTANIVASYSTGAVTAGTGATLVSGLTNRSNTNVVEASYWDTTTSGIADDADSNMPEGEPTSDLKSPTGYTGIFSTWNVSVDGVSGADDPWDFGTGSDYPALKYAGMDPHLQRGDYDRDNDGLIEIDNLAQLDAVRHDLNGNGDATAAAYAAAFPLRDTATATRMGCPSGTCTGYELIADLDFDTDGDGAADSHFVPIGVDTNPGTRFAAVFKGNGHVISNLSINMSWRGDIGLFGSTNNNARIESVGLKDVNVNGGAWTGALVGTHYGTITTSWSSGAVRGRALVGGLVGLAYRDTTAHPAVVIASYSHASVNAYGITSSNAIASGLVGGLDGDGSSNALIIASYSTGTPSADQSVERANVRGLSRALDSATIAYSYYDKDVSGFTNDPDGNGKTTIDLQTPTGYTGIYANWNVDVDGVTGGDDPWDFGGASAYPRLKYGGMDPDDQLFGDYDLDGDGLIEIRDLAQLDAVRHDLNGNGVVAAGAATTAYDAAFTDRIADAAKLMGCPSGTCSGYELAADLDFDTDGDGSTYTGTGGSAASDSGDAYHNGGLGFAPIGNDSGSRFNTTFKGNGYVISNLFIKRTTTGDVGLFGALNGPARVESMGLDNAFVHANEYVGALVGTNYGTVAASWSGGAVRGSRFVGGLVGYNAAGVAADVGRIAASYSHASAHASATSGQAQVGGLVGTTQGASGRTAYVVASYSTGPVTAGVAASVAGLTNTTGTTSIANSYWDSAISGIADDVDAASPEGAPTADLQTVATYTGIYENWNVDVDGVSGNDDPWHFGGNGEYPALKYDGMDPAKQRRVDYDRDGDGLIEISTLAQLDAVRRDLNGDGAVAAGADTTAYEAAFADPDAPPEGRMGCVGGTCSGYELIANLDFDTDGDGATYAGVGTAAIGDTGDAYYNGGSGWAPIGGDGSVAARFNTTFKGNGYTISNLFIKRASADAVGLFGAINTTARIETMSVVDAYVRGRNYVGALVGVIRGPVTTSWASGEVLANRYAGGFAGLMPNNGGGSITASYSRANVSSAGSPGSEMGGLLGEAGTATTVTASYSTGTITTTGGNRRGLIGAAPNATVTNSYWDSTTTSISATGPGAAQTTTALQNPTGYIAGGIYANWNVDVDGTTGNDDPWHFGFSSSYPTLKFGGMDPYVQYGGDYDTNDDGLIEIWTLDRLNAVRWDLDGDAVQDTTTAADWKRHGAAFPGAIAGMGCPDSDGDSNPGPCAGYELARSLDFNDADADGEVDPVRAYPNWTPIGSAATAFIGSFDGNNHKIANLKITADGASASIGLFANSSGTVKRTGVSDAQISVTGGDANTHIGALLGEQSGDALGNWSTGTITQTGGTGGDIGGLIGYSTAGRIGASWSGANVTTDATSARAGGLGGRIGGEALIAVYTTGAVEATGPGSFAGGILGELEYLTEGFKSAYVTGPVTKTGTCGGANPLYGVATGIAASAVSGLYWNTETTGYGDSPGFQQRGYTSTDLQTPTDATTIYAAWSVDVDGDGAIDTTLWDFGTSSAYPKLEWDGMDDADQTIAPTAITASTAPACAW